MLSAMTVDRLKPGMVRDAIVEYLRSHDGDSTVAEILAAVRRTLDTEVARSSVQSHLQLNVGATLERTSRGRYRLKS